MLETGNSKGIVDMPGTHGQATTAGILATARTLATEGTPATAGLSGSTRSSNRSRDFIKSRGVSNRRNAFNSRKQNQKHHGQGIAARTLATAGVSATEVTPTTAETRNIVNKQHQQGR